MIFGIKSTHDHFEIYLLRYRYVKASTEDISRSSAALLRRDKSRIRYFFVQRVVCRVLYNLGPTQHYSQFLRTHRYICPNFSHHRYLSRSNSCTPAFLKRRSSYIIYPRNRSVCGPGGSDIVFQIAPLATLQHLVCSVSRRSPL